MSLMDLFKPDWKSSNPEIRKKALLIEKDPQILIEALKEEEDESIISVVIEANNSIDLLEELKAAGIAKLEIDKKLSDLFMAAALKAETIEDVTFDQLDNKQLGQLARNSKSIEIQLQAIQGIDNSEILYGIVHNCEKKTAQQALDKISDKETLEKLVKSARHKGSRLLARKRYDDLFGDEEREQERVEAGKNKLEKILKVLEGMSTLPDWSGLMSDYENQLKKWQELSEFADESVNQRFKAACEKCMAGKAQFERRKEEEEAAQKIIDERVSTRKVLVQELLAAAEVLQTNPSDLLVDFKARWQGLGDVEYDDEKQWVKSFEKAVKSFDAKQELLKDLKAKENEVKDQLEEIKKSFAELNSQEEITVGSIAAFNGLKKRFEALKRSADNSFENNLQAIDATLTEVSSKIEKFNSEVQDRLETAREFYEKAVETVNSFEETSAERTQLVKKLQKEWKSYPDLPEKEAEKLNKRFRKACDVYFDKVKEYVEEREWDEFGNQAAKEKLIMRMQSLENIEDPKELAVKIKECQDDWKKIGQVPHEIADQLWEKFKKTGDKLYERCQAYFDEQQVKREGSRKIKEELLGKAQALSSSEDWNNAANEFKSLQTKWKEAGPAPRKAEKQLWAAFREACDTFFNRRKEYFDEVDTQRQENTVKKEALIATAEEALQIENRGQAAQKIKQLQRDWKEIGPADRKKEKGLWNQFRRIADKFFTDQRQNYKQQQAELDENAKLKDDVCSDLQQKIEALGDESDWTQLSAHFKQVQDDWKDLPQAGRDQERDLLSKLRKLCDTFIKKRDDFFDKLSKGNYKNLTLKDEYCLKAKFLVESGESPDALDKLKSEFSKLPSADKKFDDLMAKRFTAACKSSEAESEQSEEKLKSNLRKKKQFCKRMEELAQLDCRVEDQQAATNTVADMAAELQNAFDNNFGGYEPEADKSLSYRQASQEVRGLFSQWLSTGMAPEDESAKIHQRFKKAAESFYHKREKIFTEKK